jgi:hypothetical protein
MAPQVLIDGGEVGAQLLDVSGVPVTWLGEPAARMTQDGIGAGWAS